jgi:hypothetical protein
VAEKQVSCQRLGSNPLVNDQNAGPEEKIPFSTCRLGDFARGSHDGFFCRTTERERQNALAICEAFRRKK